MAGGSDKSTAMRKDAMIAALQATLGVIKQAADQVGVTRQVHYKWLKEDPEYAERILELKEMKKDFVESKLMRLIQDGDTAATIFAAKTLLKDRGYVERQEIEHSGDMNITWNEIKNYDSGTGDK